MKTLLVLLGPTGVGKTDLSLSVAEHYGTPIVSADSRQIYRETVIGTAAPTPAQLARVRHYFIGTRSVKDNYSAGMYEQEALQVIGELFRERDVVLLTGGSMMYLDAVCKGFDDIPTVDATVRQHVSEQYAQLGIGWLQEQLQALDPVHYAQSDTQNPQRMMRAVEVCLQTGQPYSSFRQGRGAQRPFRIVKIGLMREREDLYDRINRRVDMMIADGLEQEARDLYPLRHLNALNTVGYKEWFAHFSGEYDREEAIRLIKQDSRHYAKRQLTWFRRDEQIHWFHPEKIETIQIDTLLQ